MGCRGKMDLMAPQDCTLSCTSVAVPAGGRVVVAGDLFLTATPTLASTSASCELARAVAEITGPGALVVAGNLFEFADHPDDELAGSLRAHGELAEVLSGWMHSGDHRIILLPGTRDRAICYDPPTMAAVAAWGVEVAISADLNIETNAGVRQVRVEPGWRYDPLNAYGDPPTRADTPLGQHAITELFPAFKATKSGWLDGIDRLADPAGLPRFVTSRLTYRRLGRYVWWLLIPIAVALLARLPEVALFGERLHAVAHTLRDVAISLALELVAIAVLLGVVNHRVWAGPGSALLGTPGDRANDSARDAARQLVAEGYAGLVTGHTLRAELASVGKGFFANTGACAELVEERRALLGMPPVFVRDEQISFVEIEGGGDGVQARLRLSRQQRPAGSVLERACPREAPGAARARRRGLVPGRRELAADQRPDPPPQAHPPPRRHRRAPERHPRPRHSARARARARPPAPLPRLHPPRRQ